MIAAIAIMAFPAVFANNILNKFLCNLIRNCQTIIFIQSHCNRFSWHYNNSLEYAASSHGASPCGLSSCEYAFHYLTIEFIRFRGIKKYLSINIYLYIPQIVLNILIQ